jgi:microcin C transport system substrate-binding protein
MRVVDAAQYKKRLEDFDFDIVHDVMMMAWNPGEELRAYFDSSGANVNGSRNLAGISHPAVDAMVEKALKASSRQELVTACRALDRVLRAQRYWVPHWYNPVHRYAYWDLFGQPERQPKFDTGVLWTWWWDAEKARKANYRAR